MPLLDGCSVALYEVGIDSIKHGDAVLHYGKIMTVSANNINFSGFMGITLFGDSYNLGSRKVTLVKIKGAMNE